MTSASKQIGGDQYDKVRVHSAPPGQVDCRMNSIKSFQGLKVKHHLARMSESVCRKTRRHAGGNGVCFGGFNCRCTRANSSELCTGRICKREQLCLRLKSKDETSLSPVQTADFWPRDVCRDIDSCPLRSRAVSLQQNTAL